MFRALADLSMAIWAAIDDRNLGLIAAGVAFYAVFAIFPAMAATIAIWGFFADPAVITAYLEIARDLMPADAYAVLEDQFARLLRTSSSTLTWTTAISLAVGFYSAHNGVAALINGLNTIHARSHRPGWSRLTASVSMTVALIVLILAALATVVAVPAVLSLAHVAASWTTRILAVMPYAVMFVVVLTVLGMFYRWAPNAPDERHGWLTAGAIVAATLWATASIAFSVYLANFATYNRIYGSIGAVIALLMWFYISAYVVLFGGVLNAEISRLRMQRRTRQ
jgi:membrane protein